MSHFYVFQIHKTLKIKYLHIFYMVFCYKFALNFITKRNSSDLKTCYLLCHEI